MPRYIRYGDWVIAMVPINAYVNNRHIEQLVSKVTTLGIKQLMTQVLIWDIVRILWRLVAWL